MKNHRDACPYQSYNSTVLPNRNHLFEGKRVAPASNLPSDQSSSFLADVKEHTRDPSNRPGSFQFRYRLITTAPSFQMEKKDVASHLYSLLQSLTSFHVILEDQSNAGLNELT